MTVSPAKLEKFMSDASAPAHVQLPVLPLRDVVVYPHMVIPLFVGREKSMLALDSAMAGDKQILLIAQKAADIDDPMPADLYGMGTLAQVLQLLKLPDGTVKVLVEGVARARVEKVEISEGALRARAEIVDSVLDREARELAVTQQSLLTQFEQYVKSNRKIPPNCCPRSVASMTPVDSLIRWPRISGCGFRRSRISWRRSMSDAAWSC
jgi:ATP-dependent Lon protease